MCGRFTQRLSSSDFARLFGARDLVESAGEAYNVAPTQRVAAVVERAEERLLEPMRWGLVPGWAKSPVGGKHPINARAETVGTSPLFRHAFRAKRCLVPADGFFELRRLPSVPATSPAGSSKSSLPARAGRERLAATRSAPAIR